MPLHFEPLDLGRDQDRHKKWTFLAHLREDLRLDLWDCSNWKTSKEIAETMLRFLQDANSVMLLSSSKLSALKGLIAVLAVNHYDVRI